MKVNAKLTSRSIMSRGNGTSGFSPVSIVGMLAFLISFSTNPTEHNTRYDLNKGITLLICDLFCFYFILLIWSSVFSPVFVSSLLFVNTSVFLPPLVCVLKPSYWSCFLFGVLCLAPNGHCCVGDFFVYSIFLPEFIPY